MNREREREREREIRRGIEREIIKDVGAELSSSRMDGASGEAMESWQKHPTCSAGAHSVGTVAPTELVPDNMHI